MGCLFSALTYANIRHLKVNPIAVQTFSYDFVFGTCTLYSSVKVKDNILTAHRMNEKIKSKNELQCQKHKISSQTYKIQLTVCQADAKKTLSIITS